MHWTKNSFLKCSLTFFLSLFIEQQQKVSSSPKIYSPLLNCSGGRLLVLVRVDCNIAAGHHLPALPPPPAAAAIKFCWSCMLCQQQRIIFSPPKVRRVRDLHMSSVGLICLMMVAVAWFDHDITDKSTWHARRGNPLKGKSFAANLQLSLNSAEWSRDTYGCKKLLPCSANTYWWLLVISHI